MTIGVPIVTKLKIFENKPYVSRGRAGLTCPARPNLVEIGNWEVEEMSVISL